MLVTKSKSIDSEAVTNPTFRKSLVSRALIGSISGQLPDCPLFSTHQVFDRVNSADSVLCPYPLAPNSAHTKCSLPSAQAEWAKCIKRMTPSSGATWLSKFCRKHSRTIPNGSPVFDGKHNYSRLSITPT